MQLQRRDTSASGNMERMVGLFCPKGPLLPVDSTKIPKIRQKVRMPGLPVLFTYAWVILSAAVALAGYMYCNASTTRVSLVCTDELCTFERRHGSSTSTPPAQRVTFARQNLLSAQPTRTQNGEAIDFHGVRRRRQRVLGHSYLIKYKVHDGHMGGAVRNVGDKGPDQAKDEHGYTVHTILFTRYNIGRKRSRRQASLINNYVHRELNKLEVYEEKGWTVFGVLIVVFGLISGIFGAMLGELRDTSSKREKKSI